MKSSLEGKNTSNGNMAYVSSSNNSRKTGGGRGTGSPSPVRERATTPVPQIEDVLHFDEANEVNGFLVREDCSVIHVRPSIGTNHLANKSQFRFELIVNYEWENQYVPGRLVATHVGNKLIAYIVEAKGVGGVRIMDLIKQERCLMMADKGSVKDMEFMYKEDEIYIGFVNEYGTFFINRIHQDVQTGKLSYTQIYKVLLDNSPEKSGHRRFIWCKHVPEHSSNDIEKTADCAYQFAVLQNNSLVYVGHLAKLLKEKQKGVYRLKDLQDCLLEIVGHKGPVTDASFAPEGFALATASKDGTVKFFEFNFEDGVRHPPRCLYSWEPHDGRPIDKIMFLDNHSFRSTSESQYWKFILTFGENMREMKLFTCKTWECLQTVRFSESGQWKMELDTTAHYLLAADMTRHAFYLLHLNRNDTTARVEWIRELPVPFNVLSFNLIRASLVRMQEIRSKGLVSYVAGNANDYKSDAGLVYLVVNIVQPKSLQQGIIAVGFPNTFSKHNNGPHISFQSHVSYKEIVSDEMAVKDGEQQDSRTQRGRSLSPGHGFSSNIAKSPISGRRSRCEALQNFDIQEESAGNCGNSGGSKASSKSSLNSFMEEILSPTNSHAVQGMTSAVSKESINSNLSTSILFPDELENHFQLPLSKSSLHKHKKHSSNAILDANENFEDKAVEKITNRVVIMMSAQAEEMQNLKQEIEQLHSDVKKSDDIKSLVKLVESYFKDSQKRMSKLEDSVKKIESHDKSRHSQHNISNTNADSPIPGSLAELLTISIGTVVKQEIETVIPVALESAFEPARIDVTAQVDKLATILESKISSSIAHIIQKEKIWDGVTANFKTVTKSIFEQTFNDLFTNVVYSRCQNAAKEMLSQINKAFSAGTNQYLSGLQQVLEAEREKGITPERLETHVNNTQDVLSNALQAEIETQMMRVLSDLQGNVARQLEESIAREITSAFQEQKKFFETSVLSKTATPRDSVSDIPYIPVSENMSNPDEVKKTLVKLVNNGEIGKAFVQAGNLGDVDVLMHLCKYVPSRKAFESKLPHQTQIFIIQSMVVDIDVETDLKLQYLNSALATIDTFDDKIRESLQRIFPVFQGAVRKYVKLNLDASQHQHFKILEMAFAGICQQNLSLGTSISSSTPQITQFNATQSQKGSKGYPNSQHSFFQL